MTGADDITRIPTELDADGEYTPAGEDQGVHARFSARQVADAFGVELERVQRAFRGEFDLDPAGTVDSRQAQDLAEVILGDQPMDIREAGLMQLGAFTPRRDLDTGLGDLPDDMVRDQGDEER